MGEFNVTGPDGTSYKVNAPDGASEQDILAYVQKNLAAPKEQTMSAPKMGDNGATWGGTDNFASGVLQGMGDEVKALAAAAKESAPRWLGGNDGLSFGNAYDQAKTMYQGARSKYQKENPVTSTVTDIAGQAAPWVMGAGPLASGTKAMTTALGQAAPQVAPALTWMGGSSLPARITAGSLTGSGMGSISGFTNAEGDLGDRAQGAGHGAMAGALIGGAAPPVIDAVSAAGRGAYNQIAGRLPFGQETVARRKIAEALAREGMTPDQALARMNEIGPDAALMDVGRNPRSLMAAAYQTPGEGKKIIGDFLQGRQEGVRDANNVIQGGQIGRITDQLNTLVPENFYATQEGIAARNAQAPLYKEAFAANKDMAAPGIDRILETPAGRDALAYARERMQNRMSMMGTPDAELTDQMRLLVELGKMDRVPGGVSKGLKLETLDLVKQGLDDAYRATEKQVNNGTARAGELRDLGQLKSAFVRELDAADVTAQAGPNSLKPEGGSYAQARAIASDKFRNQDALEAGTTFMSKNEFQNPQELAQSIAAMTPEQLHNFRIGAVQALKQKTGDLVGRADATKSLMDIPALEQKIRMAFGDDDMFRRYISGLKGEREMFDSYAAARGNSLTAERTAAIGDMQKDPSRVMQGLQRMVSGNPMDWIGGGLQAMGGAKDRLMMPEGLSREMARVLAGRDVGPLRQVHQASQLSNAQRQAMARALTATLAPGHSGQ